MRVTINDRDRFNVIFVLVYDNSVIKIQVYKYKYVIKIWNTKETFVYKTF